MNTYIYIYLYIYIYIYKGSVENVLLRKIFITSWLCIPRGISRPDVITYY